MSVAHSGRVCDRIDLRINRQAHLHPYPSRSMWLALGIALSVTACAGTGRAQPARAGGAPTISFARTSIWYATEIASPPGAVGASLSAVACVAARSCLAGGTAYTGTPDSPDAFTITYGGGRWARAAMLPMPPRTVSSQLNDVACEPPGSCVAVGTGTYARSGLQYAFVATETNGHWAAVIRVRLPGSDLADSLNGVTCTSVGNCVAVGSLQNVKYGELPMIVTEVSSTWQTAAIMMPPSLASSNVAGDQLSSVACQAAGSCVAVGEYNTITNPSQEARRPMAVIEIRGRWLRAQTIKAPADLGTYDGNSFAGLLSVSCMPHGGCVAVGDYAGPQMQRLGMAVSEVNERWSPIELLPSANSVACTNASCLEVGSGATLTSPGSAITYAHGRWGHAVTVRPPANASTSIVRGGDAVELDTACLPSGQCVVVGSYYDKSGHRVLLAATRG